MVIASASTKLLRVADLSCFSTGTPLVHVEEERGSSDALMGRYPGLDRHNRQLPCATSDHILPHLGLTRIRPDSTCSKQDSCRRNSRTFKNNCIVHFHEIPILKARIRTTGRSFRAWSELFWSRKHSLSRYGLLPTATGTTASTTRSHTAK